MRADRLVSLVLLLRQRGRSTASELAAHLEVSVRTVLRDVDALSAAGVPVYAERGRHGGFSLLPGFRTELTGLTHDETLALLTVATPGRTASFGLGVALSSAVRKVVEALPDGHRTSGGDAARRLLVEPTTGLLPARRVVEEVPAPVLAAVRRGVLSGRRLRLLYAAVGQDAAWRTVDPVGLVTARDHVYLLARRSEQDRTYRLSRVEDVEVLPEPARRTADVDLEELWRRRCAQFLAEGHLTASVRVAPARRDELVDSAVAVRAEDADADGWTRVDVVFQDLRHAHWALWRLGTGAEALTPTALRRSLHERADAMVARYR